jgi:hypothetical protein
MSKNNNFEQKENSRYSPSKPFYNDGRILVNRVIETNSDKNHYYYGRFETYQDGGHRSFQSWTGRPSEKLNMGKIIDELNFSPSLSKNLKDSWRNAKRIESVSGNINDLEWMKQIGERNWLSSLPENKSEKNEFTHKLEINYPPEKSRISGSSSKNEFVSPSQQEKSLEQPSISNNSQELIKENQELKQQLAEIQKKLAEVLAELKNLKDNDKLVNELTQTQEKNQQLISTDNISVSQVQEQVQKSEALLSEVKSLSFTPPNSNEKENSVMPYVIGGSFILAFSGIAGLLLLKKRNKN